MRTWFIRTAFVVLVFLIGWYVLSPFKYNTAFGYTCVAESIVIKKPVASVYEYLGHSKHAAIWSVYVDHITVLNPKLIPDGLIGSRRRCYKNKQEDGIRWDETILENIPNQKRLLNIYNTKGFPIINEGLYTEQRYHALNDSTCELTFTLFYKKKKLKIPEVLKTHLASYYIQSIFKQNLSNIKQQLENGK